MKEFVCALLAWLALAVSAHAQGRQPGQVGTLPSSTPQEFDLLDKTGTWVPMGAFIGPLDPRTFGAKCDGANDDTTALQVMVAAVTAGSKVFIPGVCRFAAPLTFPLVDKVFIDGNGSKGQLLYFGTNTTNDVVVIGVPGAATGCAVRNWTIQNLLLNSTTPMTAGDGLKISDACQLDMHNIKVGGGFTGDRNFYNAIHFNGGNTVRMRGFAFSGSGAALSVNGDGTAYQFTDLYLHQGQVNNSLIGIHVCGGVGGFMADQMDDLGNGQNVLIDQACAPAANLQLNFGPGFASDATNPTLYPAAPQIGVHIADPGGPQFVVNYRGWLATATNQCFLIDAGTPSSGTPIVNFSGAIVGNCHPPTVSNGAIENQNTAFQLNVTGTRFFTSLIGKPTVYNVAGAPNASLQANTLDANFTISGGWYGTTLANGISTASTANHVATTTGNIRFNPGSANQFIMGPTGGCGVWVGNGLVTSGLSDGSTAGCSLAIGSTAFPLTSMNATTFRSGALAGFSGTKTAGACVLTITGGIITNVTGC